MEVASSSVEHISREAGDTQKGIRFQKLRAAIRFLERVEKNISGRVFCAVEFLEDSMIIDSAGEAMLAGEENKQYTKPLSFNSPAIKNTVVAFLDLVVAFQESDELKLGVYASASLAGERVSAEARVKAGLSDEIKSYQILKKLSSKSSLDNEEILVARQLVLDEYQKQYAERSGLGFYGVVSQWDAEKFFKFLESIEWSVHVEDNFTLEQKALELVKTCRFFNHRHEGLEKFILTRLLDELEKRSHSTSPANRLVSTADLQLMFMEILTEERLVTMVDDKQPDPAADNWEGITVSDFRNLTEKILSISPNYPQKSLQRLARRCSLARTEAGVFDRQYVSLRRRIYDVCEQYLEDRAKPGQTMNGEEVDAIINDLAKESHECIQTLSQSYKYNIKDRETIKGAVLTLFDECFIAFDDYDAKK
ncbi:hypothetical protein [Azohydromonas australica]|uniref:hypothetical protein n=1 Tax=Azohydromonas australica TaxID=364039 RepID=UPI000415D92E|nr:hypothetical protein [Azohydromonas australica]